MAAKPIALTRDSAGIWTATVGPQAPGLYEYDFSVDGLAIVDPANPAIQPAPEPTVSLLEVAGHPPLLTEAQDVPHGTIHVHHYQSRSLGRSRRVHVYTPPGYEGRRGDRLPVLYLLHGSGDNDATWSVHGRANFIMDNLIAKGTARPFVVVMPEGHAAASGDNTAAFAHDLLEDVAPLVERLYRVRRDPGGRAIAGLSMGGRQALTVGLGHPDRFAWVGAMSAAVPPPEALSALLADPAGTNRKVRWLWIACGRDDELFARNQDLVALLHARGVEHLWKPSPGGHEWPVWRTYLAEIATQLFAPR
jgi:enterochelin esterase family protein